MIDITDIFDVTDLLSARGSGPSFSLAFSLNGTGESNKTPANTRTSTSSVYDYDGVLNVCIAGEIILEGGRREHNLLQAGEDVNCEDWGGPSNVTISGSEITPTGGSATDRVAASSPTATILPGREYRAVATMWVDSYDPTHVTRMRVGQDPWSTIATVDVTLTTTPQRIVTSVVTASRPVTSVFPIVYPDVSSSDPGTRSIHCTDIDLIDVTGKTNQSPGEHLSVTDHGYGALGVKWYDTENGNTISSGIVTEATGAAITPTPQVLMQPVRSNPIVNSVFSELDSGSNTFENWGQSLSGSSSLTQELSDVPPGYTTAAKLTVDISDNPVALTKTDYLTSVTDGDAVLSLEIKAATSSGLKFTVKSDDGSGGSVQYLSADGTSWSDSSSEFAPSDLPTSWDRWEKPLPALNSGRNRVWLSKIETSSGASVEHLITIVQLEKGLVASTPIKTTTAAATRDADKIEFDNWDSLINTDEGVALYRMTLKVDLADTGGSYVRGGGADNQLIKGYDSGSGLEAYDGTNTSLVTSGGLAGEEIQVGVAWSSTYNKFVIGYYDPTTNSFIWGSEQAFSGWTSGGSLKLELGQDVDCAYTISKVEIYKGQPPETASFGDMKTWVEANR